MMTRKDFLRKIVNAIVERITDNIFMGIEADIIIKAHEEFLNSGINLKNMSDLIGEAVDKYIIIAATDLINRKKEI